MSKENGLPDVEGLADFVKANSDIQDKDQGLQDVENQQAQNQTPDNGQVDDPELIATAKKFMASDGRIKTKDLLKSYKEIEGFTTRVSQENAATKAELARLKEQLWLFSGKAGMIVLRPFGGLLSRKECYCHGYCRGNIAFFDYFCFYVVPIRP